MIKTQIERTIGWSEMPLPIRDYLIDMEVFKNCFLKHTISLDKSQYYSKLSEWLILEGFTVGERFLLLNDEKE